MGLRGDGERICRHVFSAHHGFTVSSYELFRQLVQHFSMAVTIVKSKNDRFVPMPPGILFINRLQFGFFSVLARLDVEADYAAAEQSFMAEFLTQSGAS